MAPVRERPRRGALMAVAIALLLLALLWWWSFAGPGRSRSPATLRTHARLDQAPDTVTGAG